MPNPLPLSHAERGLKHRNFTCAICRQRWEEGQENGPVLKDGLYVGKQCCADPDGDVIERNNVLARAGVLGAVLNAKEMRPPVYPTPLDGRSSTHSWIADFSVRPLLLHAGGSAAALVLSGGFLAASAITYDDANITNASSMVTTTSITLSVQAGASAAKGLHSLRLDGEPYPDCIDVR